MTAPDSYYDGIVAEFRRRGLNLLGRVRITTDDAPFHVEVDHARNTHLSFRSPNRCFCIQLNHMESVHNAKPIEQWRLNVDLEYDSFTSFLHANGIDPADAEDAFPYRKRPVLSSFEPFGGSSSGLQVSWLYEQMGWRDEPTGANALVNEVMSGLSPLIRHTKTNRFERLIVSWAPTFTFSGTDQSKRDQQAASTTSLFWERFGADRRKVRALSRITL